MLVMKHGQWQTLQLEQDADEANDSPVCRRLLQQKHRLFSLSSAAMHCRLTEKSAAACRTAKAMVALFKE